MRRGKKAIFWRGRHSGDRAGILLTPVLKSPCRRMIRTALRCWSKDSSSRISRDIEREWWERGTSLFLY